MAAVIDAVVIGGGAMGSSAAWHLARRGRAVAMIEQFEPGHDRGSSHGATRIFRLAYRDPAYLRLAVDSLEWWRTLEADSGEVLLEQGGQLDHGEPAAIAQIVANLESAGLAAEVLDPGDATRRWPGMVFDRAVVHSPDGGRVFAARTLAALHRQAAVHGAELSFGERVVAIEQVDDDDGGHVVVRTDRREVAARAAVIAAGSWVDELLPGGVVFPSFTTSVETPVHFRSRDAGLGRAAMVWPSFLHHVGGSAGELSFAAYGLESPGEGVKVGCDAAPGVDAVIEYVRQWHPGLDPEPVSWTHCRFTNTPDERFVIDRFGSIVVCSPCSGHGFKFTAIIGDLVADLCDGVAPQHDFSLR